MALIGKIRSNQKILIVFIGLAMVLFVVDPQTLFGGGSRSEQPIGKIFGEEIMDSDWKYDNRVEVASYNYRGQKQQYGQDPILTEQETEQVKNQVWREVRNSCFTRRFKPEFIVRNETCNISSKSVFLRDNEPTNRTRRK